MKKSERMRQRLVEIYGEKQGNANYDYIIKALEAYREDKTPGAARRDAAGAVEPETGEGQDAAGNESAAGPSGTGDFAAVPTQDPVGRLAGKVFAICYPDNVYNDTDPTLQTLGTLLRKYFPDISGIHILPERLMSHDDLWPQDLLPLLPGEFAKDLVGHLQDGGVLTADRRIADRLTDKELTERASDWYEAHAARLSAWYQHRAAEIAGNPEIAENAKKAGIATGKDEFLRRFREIIGARRNSHFNDGGFSQITRAKVDPRFGDTRDLVELSGRYALMLDYVVNHLDIDNEILEAFRRGENDGSAFIIISPEEYERRKQNGDIAKTFRPRPFPLFTGLRKYPQAGVNGADTIASDYVDRMNERFEKAGLPAPDPRVTGFLSIYFKVRNDQGLSTEDRRTVTGFIDFISSQGIESGRLFTETEIHEGQPVLTNEAAAGMAELCRFAGIDTGYADVFESYDDEIYGEKFFIYTTFSESQADINPKSEAGFRLVVDDLFHLLKSGNLAMMRMDAIKYLWKEIGKPNFDMEEGNKLIEVIRLTLSLAEPDLLPLDEVNSSDQDVYRMGSDGGFYYLFGQVNAVPAAFNSGSLRPLERLTSTMASECPDDLLLFVMLSTHDGRSVQGIGIDRPDGHVSIIAFFRLRKTVEARGGKVKYRSVSTGTIPAGTFQKACGELGIDTEAFGELFEKKKGEYRLKNPELGGDDFQRAVRRVAADVPGVGADDETLTAVTGFLTDWVIHGRAAYELCCTTRSAFDPAGPEGNPLSPVEEARRMAVAQAFVLSFGQSVPAIYLNDLLGLSNDIDGYRRSGQPRDLNRHRSHVDEVEYALTQDEFTKTYVSILNRTVHARSKDPAFYPNGGGYEFQSPAETVFLNHAYARGSHTLVIGNIRNTDTEVHIDLSVLEAGEEILKLTDRLTGASCRCGGSVLDLRVPAYGVLWLSTSS